MARDHDALRIAAEARDVAIDPADVRRRILHHAGIAPALAQPVTAQHRDIALARDIAGHEAVVRRIAAGPGTAVEEHEYRQRACACVLGPEDPHLLLGRGAGAGDLHQLHPGRPAGNPVHRIEHGRAIALHRDPQAERGQQHEREEDADGPHDAPPHPAASAASPLPTESTMVFASSSCSRPIEARKSCPCS